MAGDMTLPAGAVTTDRVAPVAGQTTQRAPRTDLEEIMGAAPGSEQTDGAGLRARFAREYGNRTLDEVKQSIFAQARPLAFQGNTLGELREMLVKAVPNNPYAQNGMIALGLGTVDAVWKARQAAAGAPTTARDQDGVEPRPPDSTRVPVARYSPAPTPPGGAAGRPTQVAARSEPVDAETVGRLRGHEFARAIPRIQQHMAGLPPNQQQDYLRSVYAHLGESERRALLDSVQPGVDAGLPRFSLPT